MKKAEIYSIASGLGPGYAWKWRCENNKAQCKDAFMLYYDCVSDAKKRGYEVEFVRTPAPAVTDVRARSARC